MARLQDPTPIPPPTGQDVVVNLNGQAMGPKGLKTRRRLIDATVELLETTSLRDLRVIDIARTARGSPATFYVYFPDVSDAVLAAISELSQATPAMMEIIDGEWSGQQASARGAALVETYMRFWGDHRTLFRVRNLSAEEGDRRFIDARAWSVAPILEAMAKRIEEAQAQNRVPGDLKPPAAAATLLAMLERLAVVAYSGAFGGEVTFDGLKASASYFVTMMFQRD